MKIKLRSIILVLLLFLTIFTIYLAISELFGQTVCITGAEGDHADCSTVQSSQYGKILGIKVTYLGTIGVILLLVFFLLSSSNSKFKQNFYEVYLLGTIAGFLGAIYFISLQFFVLKTLCSSCLVVDSTIILISVLSWIRHRNNK